MGDYTSSSRKAVTSVHSVTGPEEVGTSDSMVITSSTWPKNPRFQDGMLS